MRTRLSYSIKIILSIIYVLLLVVTILSVIRGGFGETGNGIPIPADWLFFTFVIFLAITVIQAILFHTLKDIYYKCGLWLAPIKLVLTTILEVVIDWYVFSYGYITANNTSGFSSNIWYTGFVAIFICLILIIAIIEIVGCLNIKKKANQAL